MSLDVGQVFVQDLEFQCLVLSQMGLRREERSMCLHFMGVDVFFISRFDIGCPFSNLNFHCHFSVSFIAINLSSMVPDGWTFHFTGFRFVYFFIWF